jgi:hypothetical protein
MLPPFAELREDAPALPCAEIGRAAAARAASSTRWTLARPHTTPR